MTTVAILGNDNTMFHNRQFAMENVERVLRQMDVTEIVCGCVTDADMIAGEIAMKRNIDFVIVRYTFHHKVREIHRTVHDEMVKKARDIRNADVIGVFAHNDCFLRHKQIMREADFTIIVFDGGLPTSPAGKAYKYAKESGVPICHISPLFQSVRWSNR